MAEKESYQDRKSGFLWCLKWNLCLIYEKPKTRERKDVQYIEQTSGDLTPWEEKKEIGYFRGRDSNPGRLTLCEMSMNHPEDVDARYVIHICVTIIFEKFFYWYFLDWHGIFIIKKAKTRKNMVHRWNTWRIKIWQNSNIKFWLMEQLLHIELQIWCSSILLYWNKHQVSSI